MVNKKVMAKFKQITIKIMVNYYRRGNEMT